MSPLTYSPPTPPLPPSPQTMQRVFTDHGDQLSPKANPSSMFKSAGIDALLPHVALAIAPVLANIKDLRARLGGVEFGRGGGILEGGGGICDGG